MQASAKKLKDRCLGEPAGICSSSHTRSYTCSRPSAAAIGSGTGFHPAAAAATLFSHTAFYVS